MALLNYFAKIIVFILLLVTIISCNATKRVPEGKRMLQNNTITVNNKKTKSLETLSYLRQRTNPKLLGIPLSVYWYNLGNPNYETDFDKWMLKNPKTKQKFARIFSEKQVYVWWKKYKRNHKWILKNGSAPVISDSIQIKKSVQSLHKYYLSKGYYDASVSFKEHPKGTKKTKIDYIVTTQKPYFIDSLKTSILSPVLDSIYKLHKSKSYVVSKNQIDNQNFEKEENRLVQLYRNSGIYHFGKNKVEFWIDSTKASHHKDITLTIPDRVIQQNDSLLSKPYKVQHISKVNIYTDYSFAKKNNRPQDSISYKGYHFYGNEKIKYNPKFLSNAVVIQPKSIYKDTERDLTRKYLRELQIFKPSIDIKYIENKNDSLTANIYITPLPKFSSEFDFDMISSNIKPFGLLGKYSLLARNIFRGSETLELSFQGSFLNVARKVSDNSRFFNAWEIGTSASLRIPRILFPIRTEKLIPKRMTPKTNISASIGLQRNIGLDRQNITGIMDYTWRSSSTTHHTFELLNLQFINNLRKDEYFDVFKSELNKLNNVSQIITPDLNAGVIGEVSPLSYIKQILETGNYKNTNPTEFLTVQRVRERREILTEDVLVPVISYTYEFNNRENFNDFNFSSFTGRLISSGSLATAFIKKKSGSSKKQLFGLDVAQYIKAEIEYKKYWNINTNESLVYRNFIGAVLPFGNSNIPFSRSYRAGGSNDIRAWRTFDLGPGSEGSSLEFNTGSLKFTTNLEYRFKVINSIHSALFIDAGNIWDITNSTLGSNESKFKGAASFKEIAVGSGFGIRYDFSFLVFRFDVGFKTHEPYLKRANKWFVNYNFNHAIYNISINYPF